LNKPMAARRLIVILVLLLAASVAAAALAPERRGSTTTTEEEVGSSTTQGSPGDDSGDVVERGIVASAEDPETVRLAVGDHLRLSVATEEPREIEIEDLGVIGNSDPVAPALFDVLMTEPVDAPITDTASGEVLGRVVATQGGTKMDAAARG
jgi:hypothetical protein